MQWLVLHPSSSSWQAALDKQKALELLLIQMNITEKLSITVTCYRNWKAWLWFRHQIWQNSKVLRLNYTKQLATPQPLHISQVWKVFILPQKKGFSTSVLEIWDWSPWNPVAILKLEEICWRLETLSLKLYSYALSFGLFSPYLTTAEKTFQQLKTTMTPSLSISYITLHMSNFLVQLTWFPCFIFNACERWRQKPKWGGGREPQCQCSGV